MAPATLDIPAAPLFARAGDSEHYLWEGRSLPRVTSTIDMFNGGHLPKWYADMAARECAEIVDRQARGELSVAEALDMVHDWPSRATAAIRYRDEKGAVGSIMHHAQDERLTKGLRIEKGEMLDYLQGLALRLGKADPEKDKPDGEPYSLTLARKARPYVFALFDFFDRAEMSIQAAEMVAVSLTHGYAGTLDVHVLADCRWLAKEMGRDFPPAWQGLREVSMVGDYKSSNALNLQKVRMQIEPYAHADLWGIPSEDGRSAESHPVPATQGRFALHIHPVDGAKLAAWPSDEDSWEAFLNLHQVRYHLKGEPKPKRAKAPTKTKGACPF